MRLVGLVGAFVSATLSCWMQSAAQAHDESKYPDWSGQWRRPGMALQWDTTKPMGRGQEAPLTPEYQAIFEAGLASQREGGQGNDPRYGCLPQGMPRVMSVLFPMEVLIGPKTTHILFENHYPRRIYTDGRGWPDTEDTWFHGYSIGKWIDTDGDGRFDTLEIETRHIRGPRVWDQSGMPMAPDNETVITERISLDKKGILRVEMTTADNSLTKPWRVVKTFRRQAKVWWGHDVCSEGQAHVTIGKEVYFLSADGTIMPMKKGQPPPDLKYFNQTRN
jgi:hypothetical protein